MHGPGAGRAWRGPGTSSQLSVAGAEGTSGQEGTRSGRRSLGTLMERLLCALNKAPALLPPPDRGLGLSEREVLNVLACGAGRAGQPPATRAAS